MSGQRYKLAKKLKSLQELFSTPGTIIQLGRRDTIQIRKDFSIPVLPSFLIVNEEGEVWDDQDRFQFKLEPNGTLSYQSGNLINKDLVDFLKQEKIQKIQIQNNLVWIWQNNKPIKKCFFAMQQRLIKEIDTFNVIEFLSEIRLLDQN